MKCFFNNGAEPQFYATDGPNPVAYPACQAPVIGLLVAGETHVAVCADANHFGLASDVLEATGDEVDMLPWLTVQDHDAMLEAKALLVSIGSRL